MHFNVMDIMLPAFFECLILVGIHSYLGIHVIRRQVIFVDLALAQIAALGTTVAFLFGIMPKTTVAYWFSLGFTFIGAAIFSVSRFRESKVPQEAIIGLVYALAAAISILVIDKAPHGAEHIKEMLTGNILWVKWSTIGKAALVYSLVGLFHYIFRDKFLLISDNPEKAYRSGMSVPFWDFLFYVSFGIVITHSVGTAGVLMVFVFLVVPAVTSMMITDKLWQQLLIGWTMGLVVSVLGLYVSYVADLPSGPTVVSFYGLLLLLVVLVLYVVRAKSKAIALRNIFVGTLIAVFVGLLFYGAGKYAQSKGLGRPHIAALHEEAHDTIQIDQLSEISEEKLGTFLATKSDLNWLRQAFEKNSDDFVRMAIVERTFQIDPKAGAALALRLVEGSPLPFVREQVLALVKKYTGKDFGYRPDEDATSSHNKTALTAWRKWLRG